MPVLGLECWESHEEIRMEFVIGNENEANGK